MPASPRRTALFSIWARLLALPAHCPLRVSRPSSAFCGSAPLWCSPARAPARLWPRQRRSSPGRASCRCRCLPIRCRACAPSTTRLSSTTTTTSALAPTAPCPRWSSASVAILSRKVQPPCSSARVPSPWPLMSPRRATSTRRRTCSWARRPSGSCAADGAPRVARPSTASLMPGSLSTTRRACAFSPWNGTAWPPTILRPRKAPTCARFSSWRRKARVSFRRIP